MVKRVVLERIVLSREENGKRKRVVPEIGKAFDFTKEELAAVVGVRPQAIRKVADEDANTEAAEAGEATEETVKETAPKGGKKAAASKVDDEL